MRAMAIDRFGGPEELTLRDLPRPEPGPQQVLVRIVAAGVDRVDARIRTGSYASLLAARFPLVPGWECAGVIEALGARATRFRKGDRVWACAVGPEAQPGCYAEYVAVDESAVAPMPRRLLYEEAASVPLSALGARQALDVLEPGPDGGRIVVRDASVGVGPFAVQMAVACGAKVMVTAPARHHGFLLELGAGRAVDEKYERVEAAAREEFPGGADLVLHVPESDDADALGASLAALRDGGRLVAFGRLDGEVTDRFPAVEAGRLTVEPDGAQLDAIGKLFDEGRLKTHVHKIFALTAAGEAQEAALGSEIRGKVVLNL